jgi:hypothetical protein
LATTGSVWVAPEQVYVMLPDDGCQVPTKRERPEPALPLSAVDAVLLLPHAPLVASKTPSRGTSNAFDREENIIFILP